MIKEIFATLMLSTYIGTPIVRHNQAQYYQLSGSYCVREVIDWDTLYYEYWNTDITFEINNDKQIYVSAYLGGSYATDLITYQMGITNDHANDLVTFTWTYAYGGSEYSFDMDLYDEFGNLSLVAQTMSVYFGEPYNVTQEQYFYWNCMFTKEGNPYNEVYTGWYTFSNYINVGSLSSFAVYGNVNVANVLYNHLGYTPNELYASYFNATTQINYVQTIYENDKFNVDTQNVYFTGVMIPRDFKTILTGIGTFGYVPQYQQYTFGEMIFNVVDAPIYMLSQLFSFELFGIQFYVAFMGIVTVVLICFVLRKII